MPYRIEEHCARCPDGKPYGVVNADTGEPAGCHATHDEALAQLQALYANVPEAHRELPIQAPGVIVTEIPRL